MSSRDPLLSRLHDGELSAQEAESLRAELTPEEQDKLQTLADIGMAVRNATAPTEEQLGQLDLWADLERQLDSRPAPTTGTVTSLAEARKRRQRSIRITAVFSTLAAAAALLLLLRAGPGVSNRCDIEELEVAGENATVIRIPDEHGRETALIWFDHQETDQWESL